MGRHLSHLPDHRPELSQHFFRDPELARRLVAQLPITTTTVIEIGSGTGMLTEALADCGFRVIAIEKDARLFRPLRARLIGRTNVECHHRDFLDMPFPRGEFSIVANLPFSITSATVRRITTARNPPRDAFLVVQLEAARKFAGVPSETLASLLLKPSFEPSIRRIFRRVDFAPVPRARPALLHLRQREQPLLAPASLARYGTFVSSAFGSADTAGGALRRFFTQRQVLRLARDGAFARAARVSALTLPQWLAIFRFYENVCMGRAPTMSFVLAHGVVPAFTIRLPAPRRPPYNTSAPSAPRGEYGLGAPTWSSNG